MPRWSALPLVLFITVGVNLAVGVRAQAAGDDPMALFEQKIRPVLEGTCVKCHGAEKVSGGLRLDTRAAVLEGGDNGPAIEPGDPDNSLLVQAIRHEGGVAMPPKKPKLADETIADFVTWVRSGAPDPRTAPAAANTPAPGVSEEARRHWSFQPVRKAAPPAVKDEAWVRNPVDAVRSSWRSSRNARGGRHHRRAGRSASAVFARSTRRGFPRLLKRRKRSRSTRRPTPASRVVERLLDSLKVMAKTPSAALARCRPVCRDRGVRV